MHLIGTIALATYFVESGSPADPMVVLRSPVLWGIAGVTIGVYLFFRGFPFLKRKHLIEDTPTSTVRGAALGAVEVSGTVVGPYTLISPLSESDCFYYHAMARGTSGEEKKASAEILYAPFFLDDGTGRVLVDPRGAEAELRPSVDDQQGFLSAAAADLQRRAAIESTLPPGSAAPRMPQSRPVPTETFDLNPPVVLMKGASGGPFFISWRSQRDVVKELAWRSTLCICGGPILAMTGLWLLADHLLAH